MLSGLRPMLGPLTALLLTAGLPAQLRYAQAEDASASPSNATGAGDSQQDTADCQQKDRAYVAFLACSRLLRAPDLSGPARVRIVERRAEASLVLFYFTEAAEDYSEVLTAEPDNREARRGRAEALSENGSFKESADDWAVLAAKQADDMAARINLGKNLYQAGLYAKAVAAYQEAIALDANNVVALVGLARAYDMLEERSKADENIAAALKLNAQNTATLMARGEMAERRGDKQIAIESYMAALRANGMQVKPRHALQRLGVETPP